MSTTTTPSEAPKRRKVAHWKDPRTCTQCGEYKQGRFFNPYQKSKVCLKCRNDHHRRAAKIGADKVRLTPKERVKAKARKATYMRRYNRKLYHRERVQLLKDRELVQRAQELVSEYSARGQLTLLTGVKKVGLIETKLERVGWQRLAYEPQEIPLEFLEDDADELFGPNAKELFFPSEE